MGRVRMDFQLHRERPCVSPSEAELCFAGWRRRFFSFFFRKQANKNFADAWVRFSLDLFFKFLDVIAMHEVVMDTGHCALLSGGQFSDETRRYSFCYDASNYMYVDGRVFLFRSSCLSRTSVH